MIRRRLGVLFTAVFCAVLGTVTATHPVEVAASTGSARAGTPTPTPASVGMVTSLRDLQPGSVLAVEELDAEDVDGRIFRIVYRSWTLAGAPSEVSGLVAVPDGEAPPGGWPVLAWGHGTAGVADRCAPSLRGGASIPALAEHLAAGYVVAATDYAGLGTAGVHPWLVLESEGRSVLDSVRAVRFLLGDRASDRALLLGHSQGGHAVLAAAEIAPTWAPEVDVRGVVAVAPAADVEGLVPVAFGPSWLFVLGLDLVAGWPEVYPELDAADVLTPLGRQLVSRAVDGACGPELVDAVRSQAIDELLVALPTEVEAWSKRLAQNSIHADRIDVPVMIAQGGADTVIPEQLSDGLVAKLCEAGVPVTHRMDPRADHGSIFPRSMPDVRGWLRDRLAGVHLVGDCGRG